jgi:hypothetical protein
MPQHGQRPSAAPGKLLTPAAGLIVDEAPKKPERSQRPGIHADR